MSLKAAAHHLASRGRGEDSLLVHMTPGEVHGLQALAKAHGGSLTQNPDTGLPEAGFLKNILPTLIGVGAAMTGVGAPFAAALGAGAGALTNRENPLMGAIAGGLGAYGGASIGAGLQSVGSAAITPPVAPVGLETISPEAIPGQIMNAETLSPEWTANAVAPPEVGQGMESWTQATPAAKPSFLQSVDASVQNPEQFMKAMGGGSGLVKSAAMAAAPVIMAPPEPFKMPDEASSEGYRYTYDPGYTGGVYEPSSAYSSEKRYFRPKYTRLAQGGIVSLAEGGLLFSPKIRSDDASPTSAVTQNIAQAPAQTVVDPARIGGVAGVGGLLGIPLYYAKQAAKQNPEIASSIAADTTGIMPGLIDRAEKPNLSRIVNAFTPPSVRQATSSFASPSTTGRYASGPAKGMSGASADAMMYLSGQLPSSNSRMSSSYAQQYGVPEGDRLLTTMPFNPRVGAPSVPGTVASSGNPLTLPEMVQANAPQAAANRRADAEVRLSGVSNQLIPPSIREKLLANPAFLARFKNGGELRTGGFVIPADVVSALGNGSTDAGLEALMQKFKATPIDGPGDGMSDSIPTTIEGKQKARVARGEAYLTPEQVQQAGGTKKLYAMLDRIRQNAHGKTTQQRQINPNKAMG